jgi:hypothetical protein
LRFRRALLIALPAIAFFAMPMTTASAFEAVPLIPSLAELQHLIGDPLIPKDTRLSVHVDFSPDDPYVLDGVAVNSLSAVITDELEIVDVSTTPAPTTGSTQSIVEETSGKACDDSTYVRAGEKWKKKSVPVKWKWRKRSLPSYMGAEKTVQALRRAHHTWVQLQSNCSHNKSIWLRFKFRGDTRKHATYDGKNVIEFAPLSDGILGLAFTWFKHKKIIDADMKLNSEQKWTNKRTGKGFRVINVTVHEIGHQIGLDDVYSPHKNLSMYELVYAKEMKKVTLGKGDLRGAASMYSN